MIYKKIGEYIHLLFEPLSRKQTLFEFVYSSGGSWFEKEQDRGKKHLLEHCIVARTKDLNFQEFQDYQFAQNINVNAYTGPLTMGLTFQGHYSDATNILNLLTEVAFKPTFENKILDQEKEIVLREIAERSGEPSYRLHFSNMSKIFKPDSYDNHQVLGKAELVEKTTIHDFDNLLSENLDKSHLIFSIAGGGFDTEEIYSQIQNSLVNYKIPVDLENKSKHKIDYHPGSRFNDFGFLPIVNELAHDHGEVTIYIPCNINFKNRPFLSIFDDLFLKYYGVIYDTLRNKLGLIYSMYTNFEKSQNMLIINFSTEIKNISKCIETIEQIFSDFEKNFNQKRFDELKIVLTKKMEISSDTLTANVYFSQNSLLDYGIFEDLDGYLKRLVATTPQNIKELYQEISGNLKSKKVVVVSKDSAIEKLNL